MHNSNTSPQLTKHKSKIAWKKSMSVQSDTRVLSHAQLRITRRCPQLTCIHTSASDPDSASASDHMPDATVQVAQQSGGTLFSSEVL